MGKNQSASGLTNVIQYDNNGNIAFVSGSTTLMQVSSSGAITTTGTISGSSVESASLAQNSDLLQGTGSVGFTTTGSFTTMSSSLSSRTTQIELVYATTGSNSFRATQSITGSLTVTGQIIAQTINVQQVTSSIIYSSGSNVFGCDINSRQTFTGSMYVTGSIASFSSCLAINSGDFRYRPLGDITNNPALVLKDSGVSTLDIASEIIGNANCVSRPIAFRVSNVSAGRFEAMRITSDGSVGIGTTDLPYGKVSIKSNTATSYGGLNVFANGNNNFIALNHTGTAGIIETEFSTGGSHTPLQLVTGGSTRLTISSTGVSCFSGAVCVPQLIVCKTFSASNLMLSVANSALPVASVTYDTAIIQADDVTTLKLVERNGGSADNQVLTLSTGDNNTRISTSGINPLQFFVGGSSAGCGYNGLGGKNALSIACSGISTFNYPVNMGSIGHYTNYISTSGCFAIFCADKGAILYVTSMHNNGRSTAIVTYANGVTAGAAISVVNQVTPYGPAAMGFGVCANGWVYGYQPYGGPTDFYAVVMNSNFQWAF